MSSFMKQFISKESLLDQISFEDIEEITPEEDVELAEATGEVALARKDIDQGMEASERVVAVQEELQAQNEVAEGIMEANGGQLPTEAAAGIEAGRRAAAVALGLDPDSEEGQVVVNQPQIDAMVRGEAQPATEDDNKSKGFVATLKKIWEWINEKFQKAVEWLSKVTNIIPKKFKSVYNELKAIPDADFDKTVSELVKDKEFANRYSNTIENGKLVDLAKSASTVKGILDSGMVGLIDQIKTLVNATKQAKGNDSPEVWTKLNEVTEKSIAKMKDRIGGKSFYLNGMEWTVNIEDKNIQVDHVVTAEYDALPQFSKKDALNSINVGTIISSILDLQKNIQNVAVNARYDIIDNIDTFPKESQDIIRQCIFSAQKQGNLFLDVIAAYMQVSNRTCTMLKAIISKAKSIEKTA